MTGSYYYILDTLRTALHDEPFVNTVTTGDISAVDLKKQTLFPLSHIIVNSCNFQGNTTSYNISLILADLVDISKTETSDQMTGNDNEVDVINTMLALAQRLNERMRRGDMYSNLIQVENGSVEFFRERFENNLAGVTFTFDLIVPNDMTIC